MTYSHTQRAPMYLILVGTAIMFLAAAMALPMPLPVRAVVAAAAFFNVFMAFCFKTLTVRDEGAHLAVRFGPVPLFRRRILYAQMTEIRSAKSKIMDGWGIHYVSGRGWTYNLWGFGCVEIRQGDRVIRVGTDDPDGLVRFLKEKMSP